MSELKDRFLGQTMSEYGCDTKIYLKSEADKVIAELEESHKKEVEQLLMEIVELKADYKEACDRLQTANLIKDEHTLQIAKMNGYIHHLEEERRWRKFSEEKPEHNQWILVFYPNHSQFTTGVEVARWDNRRLKLDVEYDVYTYWMPMPSAPKETK